MPRPYRAHPSIEQVHEALWKSNGAISEAARTLGCAARIVTKYKNRGKAKGLEYPDVPDQYDKQPEDMTHEEFMARRDAIRDSWDDYERAKRNVYKIGEVEIQSGLHPTCAEGTRAGRQGGGG